MHVGSHRLPDLLATLIERGEWKTPSVDRILAIPHQDGGTRLLTPSGMEGGTQSLLRLARDGYSRQFALSPDGAEEHLLDPLRAVFIAMSHDENGVCLDYRFEPPRVVVFTGERWVAIAPSFDEFWRDYLA